MKQKHNAMVRILKTGIIIISFLIGSVTIGQVTFTKFQKTDVTFTTENSALQELFDLAEKKAKINFVQYTNECKVMVEGAVYPFVFLETQPMAGGMYAKRDLEIAYNNISIFLKHQREDGRLAGMIVNLDNDIWGVKDVSIIVDEGKLAASFQTLQGLFLSEAAFELSFFLGDQKEDFLDFVKNGLKKYDAYLWKFRDSDGDGCLESWSMTDTGEDHMERLHYAPWVWPYDYPPTLENLPVHDGQLMKETWDLTGWETLTPDKIPTPMESMDIMGYSYSCRNVLSEIAKLQGEKEMGKHWREKADEVSNKMKDYLWHDERHAYFYRNPKNEIISTLTHNNLRAMYWGTMTQDMADRFIKYHLLNPEEFWTYMPLPSVAANDPKFKNEESNNWGGASQGLTYQRAIRALENYGHYAEVALLGHKLLNKIVKSKVFTQQFDPFTGNQNAEDGYGYGPTILSVLEYYSRMYGINVCKDMVHFNGLPLEEEYEYIQVIGNTKYTLQQKDKTLYGKVNDEIVFKSTAGVKVKTNLQGEVIEVVGIDSTTRDVEIVFDNQNYHFAVFPNTTYSFSEKVAIKSMVPFNYPYKQQ